MMNPASVENQDNVATDTIQDVTVEDDPDLEAQAADAPSSNLDEQPVQTDQHHLTEAELKERRRNCYKKLIIALILVGIVVFIIVDSATAGHVRNGIKVFLEWIQNNAVAGFFVFMVVYFAATVLFVPGSILTLGAGFVFANAFGLGPGVLLGTISVFVGASCGAIVAFFLGRYLLREWVQRLTLKYAIFEALDVALAEKGFRIMALLRLSPIIPFNAINYIAGVTAISFRAYAIALIAILPGTILYVFLGASAGSLADSANGGDKVTIIVVVVGIVFGVAAVFLTSYYAKKELNRVIAKRKAQQEAENQARSLDEEAPMMDTETGTSERENNQSDPVQSAQDESPTIDEQAMEDGADKNQHSQAEELETEEMITLERNDDKKQFRVSRFHSQQKTPNIRPGRFHSERMPERTTTSNQSLLPAGASLTTTEQFSLAPGKRLSWLSPKKSLQPPARENAATETDPVPSWNKENSESGSVAE